MGTRYALAVLLLSGVAIFAGWAMLGRVNELADRAERAVATYRDGTLTYTTLAGESVTIVEDDQCKRRSPSPPRECIAFFANGDEVVVTFDSADPSRMWYGPTPGGDVAIALFWGGIAVGIFALFWIWFHSPWYRRLSRPSIPGAHPPSAEDDPPPPVSR